MDDIHENDLRRVERIIKNYPGPRDDIIGLVKTWLDNGICLCKYGGFESPDYRKITETLKEL